MRNSNASSVLLCRRRRNETAIFICHAKRRVLPVALSALPLIFLAFLAGCASRQPPSPQVQTKPVQEPPSARAPSVSTAPAAAAPDVLKEAAAKPSEPFEEDDWESMFDGKSLKGWRETEFAGRGEVQCRDGLIVLNMGDPFTGLNWTNEFPTMNYEVALDAMRVMGSDFFCGLTLPVGDSFCSLIVGGWGGSLIGISSFNGMDASENETTKFVGLESKRWYRIRLRVVEGRIQGWLDSEKLIDVDTTGKRISLRPGDIEMSKPIGLASWQTTAALRQIKMRRVSEPEGRRKKSS